MKTIRRRIPARTKVFYQCQTCGTKYGNKAKARECEKRILEFKKFSIGERVRNLEKRTCGIIASGSPALTRKSPHYYFEGIVIKIIGPQVSDYYYECRYLDGKPDRLNGHVYQYEVQYVCPVCDQLKTALCYAPELKILNVVKKSEPCVGPEKKY